MQLGTETIIKERKQTVDFAYFDLQNILAVKAREAASYSEQSKAKVEIFEVESGRFGARVTLVEKLP